MLRIIQKKGSASAGLTVTFSLFLSLRIGGQLSPVYPPRDKNLNQLINEVCSDKPLIQLRETIHHLRNIRNFTTHKNSNSILGRTGGMVRRNLIRLVNLINDLFQDSEALKVDLSSEKVKRILFEKAYLDRLTVCPPLTKDLLADEAQWAYEETKYQRMIIQFLEREKESTIGSCEEID